MIRISDVKLPLEYNQEILETSVCKALKIEKKALVNISLYRRSVDARHKNDIRFTATVDVYTNYDENKIISKAKNKNAAITKPYEYEHLYPSKKPEHPPVIIGAGPAGLFAALTLAQSGVAPVLIERGKDVDSRTSDVQHFADTKILNINSNIQFGEGGAGTFSDGKLNTGTKDSRARQVLNVFASNGADKEILYNAKPHVGTDKLKTTVKNIRKELIKLGTKVLFETKLTNIKIKNGSVYAVVIECNGKTEIIETENVILAIGHSARDTFEMLYEKGIVIEQKPFSVGARIEHLQAHINKSQYGVFAENKILGAADYKLNVHLNNGRGVYTFCMCPGGSVVAAASEENTVVTNGMSEFARNNINANSALLVSVTPDDFKSNSPLAGMYYQREIEKKAFISGGSSYNAPVQKVGDFLKNKVSSSFGSVLPTYPCGTTFANLSDVLPDYVITSMKQAIVQMNNRVVGFADDDALLTGVETRSSSPIRILRNEKLSSVNVKGLFPCGEGAGYAGGIISAAVDGIKCAESIILSY